MIDVHFGPCTSIGSQVAATIYIAYMQVTGAVTIAGSLAPVHIDSDVAGDVAVDVGAAIRIRANVATVDIECDVTRDVSSLSCNRIAWVRVVSIATLRAAIYIIHYTTFNSELDITIDVGQVTTAIDITEPSTAANGGIDVDGIL